VKHSINKHALVDEFGNAVFGDEEQKSQNIESCAWLNTIAATLCVEALSSPALVESLHKKLHEILNKPDDKPDVLGKIVVTDINMGTGLPIVEGIRVLPRTHDEALNAEILLCYTGGASFTISTELWVNWPAPKFASLPISLHASFDHFEGTLTASCHWRSNNKSRIHLYFTSPPTFKLPIGSTIGHATKLVNVLQVSNLLEGMISSFVHKELVAPSGFEIEMDGGKIVSVKKLSGSGNSPSSHKVVAKIPDRDVQKKIGDLVHRSFTVSG